MGWRRDWSKDGKLIFSDKISLRENLKAIKPVVKSEEEMNLGQDRKNGIEEISRKIRELKKYQEKNSDLSK